MIPTPGQKVWVDVTGGVGPLPVGSHPGVVVAERCNAPACLFNMPGYWAVDIEGYYTDGNFHVHQNSMRPRDDPPPQQEPRREEVGNWESLCSVWQPEREVV